MTSRKEAGREAGRITHRQRDRQATDQGRQLIELGWKGMQTDRQTDRQTESVRQVNRRERYALGYQEGGQA